MGRASEAELREALEAVALEGEWRLGMGIDPDWGLLNAAIDELVRLREARLIAAELLYHVQKEGGLGRLTPPTTLLARLESAIGPVDPAEFVAHVRAALASA